MALALSLPKPLARHPLGLQPFDASSSPDEQLRTVPRHHRACRQEQAERRFLWILAEGEGSVRDISAMVADRGLDEDKKW